MPAARHALLIGIDRYPQIPGHDLKGCVNDMELMRSLLADNFGFPAASIRTLRDEEATQEGIRGALAELAGKVGEEDVVVLFYAGHGSRMADPRQQGRMIESMVTHDSGRGDKPNLDIIDEEIDRWVQGVNAKTSFVTLIFDCCHSGSVTRDPFGEQTREVPEDLRSPAEMFGGGPLPEVFAATRALGEAEEKSKSGWPGRRSAVVIAACQAEEYANEHKEISERKSVVCHGALTYFLGQALLRMQSGATWRDVFEQIAPALTAQYRRQHPLLEGKMDELLFGTEEIRPASYLQVLSVGKGTVELGGGAAHGVRPGALWTVRSSGARHRDAGDEVAAVEIQTVRAATSTARVVEARQPDQLAAGLRAFLREQKLPEPGLQVAIQAAEEPRARLAAALAGAPLLKIVEEEKEADVLIRCLEPRQTAGPGDLCPGLGPLKERTWAAVGSDGRLAVHLRQDRPEEMQGLLDDLTGVGRYRQLLELDNPDLASPLRGRVLLRVKRWNPERKDFADAVPEAGALVFREGEKAEFEIVNNHDAAVWVTLVEFGCDNKIALLMPMPGHSTYSRGGLRLEPGETVRLAQDYLRQDTQFGDAMLEGLSLHLPAGFPWAATLGEGAERGDVTLKLLVTPVSADFELLEQEATRAAGAVDGNPLEQLALLYAAGEGKRSFRPAPRERASDMDWAVVNLAVGVSR